MAEVSRRSAVSLVLGVFTASGFAALLYQVVWQRLLALFSGADVFSVTIVVSAFMAGLGCGSFAGGHLADRISRRACLVLFAAAELAVALFAVASRTLYYDVLYQRLGGAALPAPVLAAVLFASVLWPTFFMGVSLPLLSRGLTPALEAAARTVGSLYGWNTLGAAAGALVTPWLLLRRFDFPTCLWIGAALNAACAVLVLALRGTLLRAGNEASGPAAPAAARETAARPPVFGLGAWLVVYALSGTVALSLEIAWFRALGVMLKSTSFTFGTLLGIFLLGVGGGSVLGTRLVGRSRTPAASFLLLQAAIPIYAALSLAAFVWQVDRLPALATLWRYFETTEPLPIALAVDEIARHPLGFLVSDGPTARLSRLFAALYGLLPLALIGPPTLLMGLSFPFLQRAVQTDAAFLGRRVGWLQTANIAGSLVGSLATGFLLLPALGTAATFRLLAAAAAVFLALRVRAEGRLSGGSALLAAATLAALLVFPDSQRLWATLHGAEPSRALAAEDASGISLVRATGDAGDGHLVMAGGLGLSEFPYGTYGGVHTLLGALPVLIHPAPRRVAVIGLGSGDTTFGVGARPDVEEIVTIEIIGSQLEVLREFRERVGYPGLDVLFSDPRFRFVVGDGRTHVRRDPRPYDVIEADALRPSSAYAGNLYSLEYFALLRGKLAPGGMAVTWLPTERVRDTFARSFPHVLVLRDIGFGSESPIPFDRAAVLARSQEPAVRAHFEAIGLDLPKLVGEFLARERRPLRLGPEDDRTRFRDVNSDLFAKDEFLIGGRSW